MATQTAQPTKTSTPVLTATIQAAVVATQNAADTRKSSGTLRVSANVVGYITLMVIIFSFVLIKKRKKPIKNFDQNNPEFQPTGYIPKSVMEALQQEEIESLESSYRKEISKIKVAHQKEIASLEYAYQRDLSKIEIAEQLKTKELEQANQQIIKKRESQYEQDVKKTREVHQQEIMRVRSETIINVEKNRLHKWLEGMNTPPWKEVAAEIEIEVKFIYPLVKYLDYDDDKIDLRSSIQIQEGTRSTVIQADWVVRDDANRPLMVIEAKRPTVSITQKERDQARSYAFRVRAPVYMITNGVDLQIYYLDIIRDRSVVACKVSQISVYWEQIYKAVSKSQVMELRRKLNERE